MAGRFPANVSLALRQLRLATEVKDLGCHWPEMLRVFILGRMIDEDCSLRSSVSS